MAAKQTAKAAEKTTGSPRRTGKQDKQCLQALDTLIQWQDGNAAELARVLGVTRVAVQRWRSVTGAVGRESAYVAASLPGCPLTFEQIRPDVTNLDEDRIKQLKPFIAGQKAYLKQRDAQRKQDAKAAKQLLKAA